MTHRKLWDVVKISLYYVPTNFSKKVVLSNNNLQLLERNALHENIAKNEITCTRGVFRRISSDF